MIVGFALQYRQPPLTVVVFCVFALAHFATYTGLEISRE